MSHLTTCEDSRSATSSQGSASGPTPCASPDGLTINQSGQVPARASLSARQAKAMGLLTSGTCGPLSSTSSASADLSVSLANRLQAVTQTHGSTLYKLTWKEWATPSGLCRLRQRASVRRTSESGHTGWPTPVANTNPQPETRRGLQNLAGAVKLSGWQTPIANDATGSTHCYSGKNQDGTPKVCLKLPGTVLLTGWPTPTTSNTRSPSVDAAMNMYRQDGSKTQQRLQDFAGIAGPLRLTVFGEMRTGSYVEMANGVQLNPAHSRWLMGLPRAWDESSPEWQEWQAATASGA
ncbi:Uncharacterised protein [Salmonella enterica]|nr:Uncharacterised protein [Salmonella enterica]